MYRHCLLNLPSAPSAAPTSVSLSAVTSSSITLQWEMVPCIKRNGDITGYSVQYTGGGSTQTMSVSGDSSGGMYVISNLEPSTDYSIEVAAVNGELIGPYSMAMDQLTAGMLYVSSRCRLHIKALFSTHSCSSSLVSCQ